MRCGGTIECGQPRAGSFRSSARWPSQEMCDTAADAAMATPPLGRRSMPRRLSWKTSRPIPQYDLAVGFHDAAATGPLGTAGNRHLAPARFRSREYMSTDRMLFAYLIACGSDSAGPRDSIAAPFVGPAACDPIASPDSTYMNPRPAACTVRNTRSEAFRRSRGFPDAPAWLLPSAKPDAASER